MNDLDKKPDIDDVAAALMSFNDVNVINSVFKQMGWTFSVEIEETVKMAQQNSNLSIKMKAVKHLRELLREAAELSGLTANVSQTVPSANGGHTTFQAKQLALTLNPTRQIESKDLTNEKEQEESSVNREGSNPSIEACIAAGNDSEPDAGDAREPSGKSPDEPPSVQAPRGRPDDPCPGSKAQPDSERSDGPGGGGGAMPTDGRGTSDLGGGGTDDSRVEGNYICDDPFGDGTSAGGCFDNTGDNGSGNTSVEGSFTRPGDHPCIDHRPAGCNNKLFPGISGTESGEAVTEFGG